MISVDKKMINCNIIRIKMLGKKHWLLLLLKLLDNNLQNSFHKIFWGTMRRRNRRFSGRAGAVNMFIDGPPEKERKITSEENYNWRKHVNVDPCCRWNWMDSPRMWVCDKTRHILAFVEDGQGFGSGMIFNGSGSGSNLPGSYGSGSRKRNRSGSRL